MSTRRFAAPLAMAALFLTFGGPARAQPEPDVILDAFEGVVGPLRTSYLRPSHAKGTCATAQFIGAAEGARRGDAGVEMSDDPTLQARAAAYAVSQGRRTQ